MEAIQGNERIRELAINPLMLTVIALVHFERVKLPDRRAELYAEAVNVLLGKWDGAKKMGDFTIFDDRPFDIRGPKRVIASDRLPNARKPTERNLPGGIATLAGSAI